MACLLLHAVVELSTNLELRKVWDHESFPHIEVVEKHDGYDTVYWQVLLCYLLAIIATFCKYDQS